MAGDNMATKLVAYLQRSFQIYRIAHLPATKRGLRKGFARRRHSEPGLLARPLIHNGQADSGAGNGGANVDRAHVIPCRNDDMRVATLFDMPDLPDVVDDACEHEVLLDRERVAFQDVRTDRLS